MTNNLFIPLSIPDLRGKEAAYLAQCVEDNWVSSAGPSVTAFEGKIAALTGRAHAVATINGTASIHLALLAAGVGHGDRVVVPDWTFAASANAVYHAGAEPFFIDISHDGWTLDASLIGDALAIENNRIKAIIAVHTLGQSADMDALAANAQGLPLIEDAAGAIGASYHDHHVGKDGTFATFSFNGNKTVTAGGGGMVVCDDSQAADRLRHLSQQARTGAEYIHDEIGFNYRMTNLNAAVGLAQLERLNEMVAAKRAIAARYDQVIAGRQDLACIPRAPWTQGSCWLYSILTASPDDSAALIVTMSQQNIEARGFWRSISEQAPFKSAPKLLNGVSQSLTGRVVSLPCSSQLTEGEQFRVIDVLQKWRGSAINSIT
ncbi:MAG: pyridoxal-5'-phosphate-dependent protein [Rhodospirillaceae bacterium]|nr:pyridoxal-5'-phosphate-dependent protein [Rhodospirillaceae bacterium]